jgi:hypothetical protein
LYVPYGWISAEKTGPADAIGMCLRGLLPADAVNALKAFSLCSAGVQETPASNVIKAALTAVIPGEEGAKAAAAGDGTQPPAAAPEGTS